MAAWLRSMGELLLFSPPGSFPAIWGLCPNKLHSFGGSFRDSVQKEIQFSKGAVGIALGLCVCFSLAASQFRR